MSSNKPEKDNSNNGSKNKQDKNKSKDKDKIKDKNKNDNDDNTDNTEIDDLDIKTEDNLNNNSNNNNNMFDGCDFKVIEDDNGIVDASRSLSACLKFYLAGGFGRFGSEIALQQFEFMNKYIKDAAEPRKKRHKKNNNNKSNSIVSYSITLIVFPCSSLFCCSC